MKTLFPLLLMLALWTSPARAITFQAEATSVVDYITPQGTRPFFPVAGLTTPVDLTLTTTPNSDTVFASISSTERTELRARGRRSRTEFPFGIVVQPWFYEIEILGRLVDENGSIDDLSNFRPEKIFLWLHYQGGRCPRCAEMIGRETFTLSNVTVTSVPLPASAVLLAAGLILGFGLTRRRARVA